MKRVEGTADVKLLECISPAKNKWRIRWDIQPAENGLCSYMETEFKHKPTEDEIKSVIVKWINDQTDEAILCGFSYEGEMVWLSSENRFNYKAAYDLSAQTGGATLPVMFKLGTDERPFYKTFTNHSELEKFYFAAILHIQNLLAAGWKKKDDINLSLYKAD